MTPSAAIHKRRKTPESMPCTSAHPTTCTGSNSELGIRHGKHILVEKPLAHSLEDASAIVRSAARCGVNLMVSENVRYMAQVRKCRELVFDGAVGHLRFIQFQEEYPSPIRWLAQLTA